MPYKNYDLEKQYKRDQYLANRKKVFDHYGYRCQCCGEATPEFLCIDHILGGGERHRKIIGSGNLYKWLIQNKYPEGYQVLCHNCNMAKGSYGVCPHKIELYNSIHGEGAFTDKIRMGYISWRLRLLTSKEDGFSQLQPELFD